MSLATVLGLSHHSSRGTQPKNFPGNRAKELEGSHHARQDRFGALTGQGQDKGVVGVGPDGDQEGDQASAGGEIDMDVAEIGFEPLAGGMSQGDEGLAVPPAVLPEVTLDLAVAAGVAVFGAQAAKHPHGGVPLFGRSVLVVGQDLVDDGMQGSQDGCGSVPGLRVRNRLGLVQDLADPVPRVMERARDLVDGHAIPMRPANGPGIVHRKHILNLSGGWLWSKKATLRGGCWGGSELGAHFALGWVRFTRSFPQASGARIGQMGAAEIQTVEASLHQRSPRARSCGAT